MPDRIPPLAALRAFAAVARHGSFARAAEALHVSTSAVSHQIRRLEEDLGTTLLVRARNGADNARTTVTAAGQSLLQAVDRAFAELAAACDSVRAGGKRPMLTISANGSMASLWLAPLLAGFAAKHPSVQWQMRTFEEIPDMAREGLDLAIFRARPGHTGDGDTKLFGETVFPVCSPALGLTGDPEALSRHNLLQESGDTNSEKDWSTWLELLGLGARAKVTRVEFSTFNAAIAAALAGAGIALGRRPLIDSELANGRLVRPFPRVELPGSWDMVIRRRPGLTRNVHVALLERFLLQAVGAAAT
jgi:LysR family transcriptional regulator, glycine cleavage system transcriptional activator